MVLSPPTSLPSVSVWFAKFLFYAFCYLMNTRPHYHPPIREQPNGYCRFHWLHLNGPLEVFIIRFFMLLCFFFSGFGTENLIIINFHRSSSNNSRAVHLTQLPSFESRRHATARRTYRRISSTPRTPVLKKAITVKVDCFSNEQHKRRKSGLKNILPFTNQRMWTGNGYGRSVGSVVAGRGLSKRNQQRFKYGKSFFTVVVGGTRHTYRLVGKALNNARTEEASIHFYSGFSASIYFIHSDLRSKNMVFPGWF